MAKAAIAQVEVTLSVTAQLEADDATHAELRAFIERDPDMVREAVAKAVRHAWREAGWLDESRSVFVTDLHTVEPVASPDPVRVV